jgi:hypothetical protein
LQAAFQVAILSDDLSIIEKLSPPPTGTTEGAFAVYENAYGLRLYAFMEQAYPVLLKLVGEDAFREIVQSFIESAPSTHRNARYYARGLSAHMQSSGAFPVEWCEMAAFEQALEDAFDAENSPDVTTEHLQAAALRGVDNLHFTLAASVQLLRFSFNTTSIWWALTANEDPPELEEFAQAIPVLVFRMDEQSRYRLLGDPEFMLLRAAQQNLSFAQMVEMLAFHGGPEAAASEAAGFLQNWISTGMIAGFS